MCGKKENLMKNKILKMVVKYFNLKGFIMELFDDVVEEAVMKAVAKSKTKVDDTFVPMIYPMIEEEILAQIDEKLDLSKIFGLNEEAK